MDADRALSMLGKYNRWQLEKYFIIAFGFAVPFVWISLSIIFIGDTPNYRCALPPNSTLNETIPWRLTEDGSVEYDKCSMYLNFSVDNTTVPCRYGYWYDPESGYESTLSTEWDLVCGKEWLVELSMIIRAGGAMVGALLFNRLSDRYGRKMIFLGCLWSNIFINLVMTFSPNIACYTVLSFVSGMQEQGAIGGSFVLAVELFPTEERTFAGNAVEIMWALAYMTLAVIAYFVRNWRYLLVTLTLPLVVTISFYWLIPESIPWLISNGRKDEAEKILKEAAKRNKLLPLTDIFMQETLASTEYFVKDASAVDDRGPRCHNNHGHANESERTSEKVSSSLFFTSPESTLAGSSEQHTNSSKPSHSNVDNISVVKYAFADVMKSRTIRRYGMVVFATWFVNGLAYYAINITVTYLPGNRYLNTFFYAAMELPAYLLAWILSDKVGRRQPLIGFHIVGGLALMGTLIQLLDFSEYVDWLVIILSMIGKLSITATFALIYVITPELFPTNSRGLVLGICQMFSRSAELIAPYARILHRNVPWLPPLLIGALCSLIGLLCCVVPETRHTKLPETIKEIEEWEKPAISKRAYAKQNQKELTDT